MSTVGEVRRLTRWTIEITERRARGEEVPAAELLEYQRAKVALLARIAERDETAKARETLAEARARLAEMEAA